MSPRPRLSDADRNARRQQIVDAARQLAEVHGWNDVTTRALAMQLGCSQPTIYQHFTTMDAVRDAVAVDGFAELAKLLRAAVQDKSVAEAPSRVGLTALAIAYVDFAQQRPALYAAMFAEHSGLSFGSAETPAALREGFQLLAAEVPAAHGDHETVTELMWSALHGLATLESRGRLRPGMRRERIDALVALMATD